MNSSRYIEKILFYRFIESLQYSRFPETQIILTEASEEYNLPKRLCNPHSLKLNARKLSILFRLDALR